MESRMDRTTNQDDGLHYHVYEPMEDPRNPGMILMYRAVEEPFGSRSTANREAVERRTPFFEAVPMVRQCRAPLCVPRHNAAMVADIAARVRAAAEQEDIEEEA